MGIQTTEMNHLTFLAYNEQGVGRGLGIKSRKCLIKFISIRKRALASYKSRLLCSTDNYLITTQNTFPIAGVKIHFNLCS